MLWWNGYDTKRKEGLTLQQSLNGYLDADMLAKAGNGKIPHNTRAMAYFVQTIRLLNKNHIKPLIVIMPYHPRALSAFLSVGWGVKERWLRSYLSRLSQHLDFRVLDCLHISTFGGTPDGFYDGAHLTAENSRRLIRYCIAHAPGVLQAAEAADADAEPEPVAELERRAAGAVAGPGPGVHAGARGHERAGGLPRVT